MGDTKNCPNCGLSNYRWRVSCNQCGTPLDPPALPTGALVLQATATQVDDIGTDADGKPVGKAYTAVVPLLPDVPARDYDTGYLARWRADMVAQEARHGIGVDLLAEQAPYIYSKGRIRASLRG